MKPTHKKVYMAKNKRSQMPNTNSDPITDGIKACILSKVDRIYDHIQSLHNQSSFLKTYSTAKSHNSPFRPSPASERPTLSTTNPNKTSYSCPWRNREDSSVKKYDCGSRYEGKSQIFNIYQRSSWRRPTSQSQIRQMLKKRTILQRQDNNSILQNPYYKIMKRRVKTSVDPKDIVNSEQLQKLKVKTEWVKDPVDEDEGLLKSNYSTKQKGFATQSECEPKQIRQKSETKIYEQIKKYFEEKYCGSHRPQGKK